MKIENANYGSLPPLLFVILDVFGCCTTDSILLPQTPVLHLHHGGNAVESHTKKMRVFLLACFIPVDGMKSLPIGYGVFALHRRTDLAPFRNVDPRHAG